MTKAQAIVTTKATTPRERTYYGLTAKQFLAIAQTASPQELANMRAFLTRRMPSIKAKRPSRVARWERVGQALDAKLGGVAAAPRKAAKQPKVAKPADASAAIRDALAAFGGDANALLLAVAQASAPQA